MSNGEKQTQNQSELAEEYQHELTGLPNRRWLDEQLPNLIEKHKGKVAILAIDADGIKAINDTKEIIDGEEVGGHEEGDKYLKNLAEIIDATIRTHHNDQFPDRPLDIVAIVEDAEEPKSAQVPEGTAVHISGDELVVVLPGVDAKGAHIVANRLQDTLDEYGVPISVGLAAHLDGETPEEFRNRADADMYTNKLNRKLEANDAEQLAVMQELYAIAVKHNVNLRDLPLVGLYLQSGHGLQHLEAQLGAADPSVDTRKY